MRHYSDSHISYGKYKDKRKRLEDKGGGFRCSHCKRFVVINHIMGTQNRNHCNMCLWSKHVDVSKGDRLSTCGSGMEPIGLTLKHEGFDRVGEIMLIHRCLGCQKISINRIARDDSEMAVLGTFDRSTQIDDSLKQHVENNNISILDDGETVTRQLFGYCLSD